MSWVTSDDGSPSFMVTLWWAGTSLTMLSGIERKAARAMIEALGEQFLKCGSRAAEREFLARSIDSTTLDVLRVQGKLTDDEIIDLIKYGKVNVKYLRLVLENEAVLKECPGLVDYVKFVDREGSDGSLQKWLNKRIDGAGSLQSAIVRLREAAKETGNPADEGLISMLRQSEMRYVYNIKGGYGEYKAYNALTKLYPDAEIALKLSNKGGFDFAFRSTRTLSDGTVEEFVKVVEVKTKKSLSKDDLQNYVNLDSKTYNINYAVVQKGEDYFRDANGKGLPVELDFYLYDENSESLAKWITDKLPADKKIPYEYKKKIGPYNYITFVGDAIVNVIPGSL